MKTLFLCLLIGLVPGTGFSDDILRHNSLLIGPWNAVSRPVVIFESGMGDGAESWSPLLPYAPGDRVLFLYNRAGYWHSPPGPLPRTGDQVARELHKHLEHEGLKPPYLLVGHSLGGLFVQMFSRLYPGEVAGLVLVDPAVPEHTRNCRRLRQRLEAAGRTAFPDSLCQLVIDQSWPDVLKSEYGNIEETGRILEILPVPRIPTVLLSARQTLPAGTPAAEELLQMIRRQHETIAAELGAELRFVRSGHYIHREHPGFVARAIGDVLTRVTKALLINN